MKRVHFISIFVDLVSFSHLIGIVAPIQLKGVDSLSGGRTSTPEEEAADEAVSEVTKERRKLNIEIKQTNEMIAQKTEIAEREQLIEEELKFIHREFYCECCDKQYKNVAEVSFRWIREERRRRGIM
jgi:hypothetical protein